MIKAILFALLIAPVAVLAQDYTEPRRGTETRREMLAAVRPHAEWSLGEPIEFVVDDIRVWGSFGFATLSPQRPGGGKINFWETPLVERDEVDPEFFDGTTMHVLYQKSGSVWVAVHWSVGSTDVWWASPEFCEIWAPVTPEFCFGG